MRLIIFFLITIFTLLLIFTLNIFSIKDRVYWKFPSVAKTIEQNKYYYFKKDRVLKNIQNDYNVNFLPDTQFESLNLKKINLIKNSGKKIKSFSIDFFDDRLFISTSRGFFYYVNFNKLSTKKNEDKINLNTIKTLSYMILSLL